MFKIFGIAAAVVIGILIAIGLIRELGSRNEDLPRGFRGPEFGVFISMWTVLFFCMWVDLISHSE